MYAYVAYKDGAKAVVAASLIRDFRPSSETDLASGKNKMIYWREKQEEGELEDYFPGDVVELAESKEDLARKLFRRRIRFPEHVFDDVLKAAPSRGEPSQKEKKKRKEAAKRKEMVALSELPAAEGEERNNKVARLEQEIVSLRRKLADQKKRNRELQEVVVKGMGKHLCRKNCWRNRAAAAIGRPVCFKRVMMKFGSRAKDGVLTPHQTTSSSSSTYPAHTRARLIP
ncbi:hypothetical protein HPB51_026606 [Rhipicephalus microplus]|uniref:Uncharacterized protein n=1 Tax=Rhipicephalus microplus TaxID=6941 RepID=A0A9J6D2G1_RHIMP|nr:hypothetical protein HPB51_026606 [Rhipicephalus microplus]